MDRLSDSRLLIFMFLPDSVHFMEMRLFSPPAATLNSFNKRFITSICIELNLRPKAHIQNWFFRSNEYVASKEQKRDSNSINFESNSINFGYELFSV